MEPQKCPKKDVTDWRLMVVNINNFPTEANGQEKAKFDILKQEIVSSNADIVGLTELGRNENNLPHYFKPSNIVKKMGGKRDCNVSVEPKRYAIII